MGELEAAVDCLLTKIHAFDQSSTPSFYTTLDFEGKYIVLQSFPQQPCSFPLVDLVLRVIRAPLCLLMSSLSDDGMPASAARATLSALACAAENLHSNLPLIVLKSSDSLIGYYMNKQLRLSGNIYAKPTAEVAQRTISGLALLSLFAKYLSVREFALSQEFQLSMSYSFLWHFASSQHWHSSSIFPKVRNPSNVSSKEQSRFGVQTVLSWSYSVLDSGKKGCTFKWGSLTDPIHDCRLVFKWSLTFHKRTVDKLDRLLEHAARTSHFGYSKSCNSFFQPITLSFECNFDQTPDLAFTSKIEHMVACLSEVSVFQSFDSLLKCELEGKYVPLFRAMESLTDAFHSAGKIRSDGLTSFDQASEFIDQIFEVNEECPAAGIFQAKSIPGHSLLANLACCCSTLASVLGMGLLWKAFVERIRIHWENCQEIPGVGPSVDNQYCLIYQKLQMINYCRQRRETNNVSESQSKAQIVPGVYHIHDPTLPICAPQTQEPGPMTDDMIEEQECLHQQLEANSLEAENVWSYLQTKYLQSDMQSFKAANPNCCLEDFVRWYSPNDWSEEGLSERMSAPDNRWQQLWDQAKPLAANIPECCPVNFQWDERSPKELHL